MTDQDVAAINQQLAQDPTYRALLAQFQDPATYAQRLLRGEESTRPVWEYLRQKYGVESRTNEAGGLMGPEGWKINEGGQLVRDHDARNTAAMAAATMAGGYGLSFAPGWGLNAAAGAGGFSGPWGASRGGPSPNGDPGFDDIYKQASSNGAGGSDLLELVKTLTGLGGSLAMLANRPNTPAMDPGQQALMNDALQMGNRRLKRIEPVHEAAMRLAMNLAPSGGNERVRAAALQAQQPAPERTQNPAVMEAVRRLAGVR